MSVNGVSGSGSVGTQSLGFPMGGSMSADTLLAYCAVQLNAIDGQLQAQVAQQNQARDVQQVLNNLKNAIGIKSVEASDQPRREEILNEMKAAYDKLPQGDPARTTLDQAYREFATTACFADNPATASTKSLGDPTFNAHDLAASGGDNSKNAVDTTEMQHVQTILDTAVTDVSKGAELKMIELNQLVSQRQMAVQQFTGMISKWQQGLENIVAQIGK